MRRPIAAAIIAAAMATGTTGFCAAATGAAPSPAPVPAPGEYEAVPVVDSGTTYQVGGFAVVKSAGKRKIVSSGRYGGIFYPDVGKCDDQSLPLAAESIPISSKGRFKHHERTPVDGTAVDVTWKGHWTKAKRVKGTITIRFEGCTSTESWTGRKVG